MNTLESKTLKIVRIELDDQLEVAWENGDVFAFSFLWLQDNATDETSFDARTNQRRVFTAALDAGKRPLRVWLTENGYALEVQWSSTDPPVRFGSAYLRDAVDRSSGDQSVRPTLHWDSSVKPPSHTFDESRQAQNHATLLEDFSKWGFVLLRGCPREASTVTGLANCFGYVRQSIFGGVWTFEADAAMDDSAYSNEALRPHTDGTYMFDPPGAQILLCLDQSGEGAESILVDGFSIADQIREHSPEVFETLTTVEIEGAYIGDGVELRARHPVFRQENNRVRQVCFNNYDRSPVWLPPDDMVRFYDAIRVADLEFNDPANQWRYTLKPGEALIFDNWRLLHGREAFTGKRRMTGAYINREDIESRYRTMFAR